MGDPVEALVQQNSSTNAPLSTPIMDPGGNDYSAGAECSKPQYDAMHDKRGWFLNPANDHYFFYGRNITVDPFSSNSHSHLEDFYGSNHEPATGSPGYDEPEDTGSNSWMYDDSRTPSFLPGPGREWYFAKYPGRQGYWTIVNSSSPVSRLDAPAGISWARSSRQKFPRKLKMVHYRTYKKTTRRVPHRRMTRRVYAAPRPRRSRR